MAGFYYEQAFVISWTWEYYGAKDIAMTVGGCSL